MNDRKLIGVFAASLLGLGLATEVQAQTPQAPGKSMPMAMAPTKSMPMAAAAPQAPGKSMPTAAPQMPSKTMPAAQR